MFAIIIKRMEEVVLLDRSIYKTIFFCVIIGKFVLLTYYLSSRGFFWSRGAV